MTRHFVFAAEHTVRKDSLGETTEKDWPRRHEDTKLEDRRQKSEDRSQKTEVRSKLFATNPRLRLARTGRHKKHKWIEEICANVCAKAGGEEDGG